MTLKYQTLRGNTLLLLIIINLQKKYLMKKEILEKDKGLLDKSDISNLVKNSDLNKILATLAT